MVSKPQGYSFTVGLQVAWSTISPTAAMALLRGKVALSGPTLLENRVVLTCEHGQEQMLSAYQVVNLLCFKSEIIERNRTRRRNSRVKASRVSPMHERWLAHTHIIYWLSMQAVQCWWSYMCRVERRSPAKISGVWWRKISHSFHVCFHYPRNISEDLRIRRPWCGASQWENSVRQHLKLLVQSHWRVLSLALS